MRRTIGTVVHRLYVLPGVAGALEGLYVGDQIAPAERQRHDVVGGEEYVPSAAPQAQATELLAQSLELPDREVALCVKLPRPTPGELYCQLVWVLLAPALQVRVEEGLPLLGLVALALVFVVIGTTVLVRLTTLLKN